MSRSTLIAVLVLAALAAAGGAGVGFSGATFTSAGTSAKSTISSGYWTAPTVSLTDPGSPLSGTVTVNASAASAAGIASVAIEIAPAGGSTWQQVCRDTSAPYSCPLGTAAHPDGRYDLRAIAVDTGGLQTTSAVVASRLFDNGAPAVSLESPAQSVRGTVSLTATASDGAGTGVASVRIQRASAGGTQWTDICTVAAAPYTCAWDTTRIQNDVYDLRAVATDGLGRTTNSAIAADIEVDNLAPTVATTDPGSPLSGVVTLAATASDADSGVASVRIQTSPAGAAGWTTACTINVAPFSCRVDTTKLADGLYDVRAIAIDVAGNERIATAVLNRRVDNSVSSVSVEDPGLWLTRTVTVNAAASSTNGVRDVVIQYSPAGKATWTTICTDTATPFSCTFDTATAATPDGLYDLRAVLTDTTGKAQVSAVVANRRVDNSPVRGWDVQSFNGAGGVLGRIQAADSVLLTWNKEMAPATLIPGWTGAGAANLLVRLRDAAVTGTVNDGLDFLTSGGAATTGLGSIDLGGDYARSGRTAVHSATATLETTTVEGRAATAVRITLGAVVSGNGSRTAAVSTAMTWTPSATAKDLAGTASSTAPVVELGAADRDF
jgi:hypothetical protein